MLYHFFFYTLVNQRRGLPGAPSPGFQLALGLSSAIPLVALVTGLTQLPQGHLPLHIVSNKQLLPFSVVVQKPFTLWDPINKHSYRLYSCIMPISTVFFEKAIESCLIWLGERLQSATNINTNTNTCGCFSLGQSSEELEGSSNLWRQPFLC